MIYLLLQDKSNNIENACQPQTQESSKTAKL